MRFETPSSFFLLFIVLIALLVFWQAMRRKQRFLGLLGEMATIEQMVVSAHFGRQWLRGFLVLGAMILFILALARPQFGIRSEIVKRLGVDLVIALDTSKSMTARDIPPSRLERAKLELSQIIDGLEGDRLGIVAFSGRAFVQCPMTTDRQAAKLFLRSLDTSTIPRPGTNLEAALSTSVSMLEEESAVSGSKAIILLTDGENHEGEPSEIAQAAKENGIVLFIIGYGSPSGEPIPLLDESGGIKGYYKDRAGKTVMSRANETLLLSLATTTGGRYFSALHGEAMGEQLLEEIGKLKKHELENRTYTHFDEKFQHVLIPAFLLLLLELFLSEKAPRENSIQPKANLKRSTR